MVTASPIIPAFPPANAPVIDPATGLMSKIWYEYFRALDQIVRVVRTEV